jgi:hypothetical protein
MILTEENLRTWRKTCPSATSSTTNAIWTDPGMNPVLWDERTATNYMSHGTAIFMLLAFPNFFTFHTF